MDFIWLLDEEWGCSQRNLRGKKRNLFFLPSREKGKEDARSQVNIQGVTEKTAINLKRIWYQPYFFLWQLLQISFRCCKNLTQAALYAEIHCKSIILTSKSSICLLRSKNQASSTEQELSMIFFLDMSN